MRRLTWVAFVVALFAFVLPFATVSCGGVEVEPSGAELVVRAEPEPECFGRECPATNTDDEPRLDALDLGPSVGEFAGGLASAAFIAFAAALVLARTGGTAWAALAGLVGVGALIVLGTRDNPLAGSDPPDDAAIVTDPRMGYWIALGAGAAGTLAALGSLVGARPSTRPVMPAIGGSLLLVAYLLPSRTSESTSSAAVDSLDLRHPWLAVSSLLPALGGLCLWSRRKEVSPQLALPPSRWASLSRLR